MKTYEYRNSVVFLSFFIPEFVMCGVLAWGLFSWWTEGITALSKMIVIVMPVLILSTFVGIHNPTSIKLGSESIVFQAFGMKHEYKKDEIFQLKVKSYRLIGKTLVRIGKPQIFGGRYWFTKQITGYDELISALVEEYGAKHERA